MYLIVKISICCRGVWFEFSCCWSIFEKLGGIVGWGGVGIGVIVVLGIGERGGDWWEGLF